MLENRVFVLYRYFLINHIIMDVLINSNIKLFLAGSASKDYLEGLRTILIWKAM